jgi:ring-1,2-phenylacetyl-CoA epoxidase subunit PaaB
MTERETSADAEADTLQLEPDPDADGVEPYEVFVQWKRGQPHEHAETIDAPTDRMALMLAKRNIDMRQEPLSIWVVPRGAVTRTTPEDPTLTLSTDRSYRNITWYAENKVDVGDQTTEDATRTDGGES